MAKNKETMELPIEGFAILIKAAAQAILNELGKPAIKVNAAWMHDQVGVLDELVGKFETLHRRENEPG